MPDATPTPAATRHDIVPPHLAVRAMRDNGYTNAAYALAELIDNAVQAGAEHVELLCGEKTERVRERRRRRIHQIAVLDDGAGMDAETLQLALQFGNGTHLDPAEQGGIGKFGMGLPASSVSQCRRVDVWSWQDGVDGALWTYLDVEEIAARSMTKVPTPEPRAVPELWRRTGSRWRRSGTLVVWSELDRVLWKTARSIVQNSEHLIGRMYRRFLAPGGYDGHKVGIRMFTFDVDRPDEGPTEKWARPNDPLYLTAGTSCPPPYGDEPMFKPYGEPLVVPIEHEGATHDVIVRWSIAKEAARARPNAGSTVYGKHAARNVGVSIVRAGRELELDDSWALPSDARERWWGIEVEFPPALDDVFGVTNNKQAARNFTQLEYGDLQDSDETEQQTLRRLREDNPALAELLSLSRRIDRTLEGDIRPTIKAQTKGNRTSRSQPADATHSPEARATAAAQARRDEGHRASTDAKPPPPPEQQRAEIEQDLKDSGVAAERARRAAEDVSDRGLHYQIVEASVPTSAFFTVEPKAGALLVKLNTSHPAYDTLFEALDADAEGADAGALRERLEKARDGLRLLLLAWARYEDELPDAKRPAAQDARTDWGRVARDFLRVND